MMRWGMPPPTRSGGPPVTNIRNTASPHRCIYGSSRRTDAWSQRIPSPNTHRSQTPRPRRRTWCGSRLSNRVSSPIRYGSLVRWDCSPKVSRDGCNVPAIDVESMSIGQGALGSKSPATAGLKIYRRPQTATLGGRSVTKNASLPALSISQNGTLGSPAWLARFCAVILNGKACS